jgi:two-component sensor histidine kinase
MKVSAPRSEMMTQTHQSEPPAAPSRSDQMYWILQCLGWGSYSTLRIIAAIAALEVPWATMTVEVLVLDGLGFVASHALRRYVRRNRWIDLPIPQMAGRIVTAGFIVGVPLGFLTQLTHVAALQDATPMLQLYFPGLNAGLTLSVRYALQMMNWAVLFVIWQVIYFIAVGLREYRSARLKQSEMARALQLAELRLLKSQLNPHFFFNALNTVRSLISENPRRAHDAVTRLANTLRHTLRSRQDELIPLSQEMEIVRDYLELESMRFEDRLRTEIFVPIDASTVRIPVMLLQTLVENAIKHGIGELPEGGLLRISAALEDDALVVEVENPRPIVANVLDSEGIGLRNARDRLRLLFGGGASLLLDVSRPDSAIARLRIPRNP